MTAEEHAEQADHLTEMLAQLEQEFPRFRIVDKQHSPLSKSIDVALKILTLGGQRQYMTRYHTVIGDTLYVPSCWQHTPPLERVITLRHERVHLRQRRRYTLLGMSLLYLLPFAPLGLAYGRARIEWEAYRETMQATFELKGERALRARALREHIIGQFTSAAYGWMWPFRSVVGRWYDSALKEISPREAED